MGLNMHVHSRNLIPDLNEAVMEDKLVADSIAILPDVAPIVVDFLRSVEGILTNCHASHY